jgi:hypothetical protein
VYCPLCKAEYRAGFDRCSDCLGGLVATREQADSANVVLLWQGISQSKFNDIVATLRDANVPNLARSGARAEKSRPIWTYLPIVSHLMRVKEMHEQMSWQVFVLQSDSDKARGAVENQV